MSLEKYQKKRDFRRTPEPRGGPSRSRAKDAARRVAREFVIQKHAASRLHYDLRLELEGVLKSWAVPKGPSLDPAEKRLAVHVEDHPLEYGSFEGVIPEGEYGGGTVLLWDRGEWIPEGDPRAGYRNGRLAFELSGEKLRGSWRLVRMRGDGGEDKNWLLIKHRDAAARSSAKGDILEEREESVITGRDLAAISADRDRIWRSGAAAAEAEEVLGPRPSAREAASGAAVPDPSHLPGATSGDLPDWVPPQLATRVSTPPGGEGWLHEIKFDGYRMLCRLAGKSARLLTRRGLDWTDRFGRVAEAAARLPSGQALIDGEIVALRPDGRSSFQALQEALSGGGKGLVFHAFDLLHLDGYDLTASPLEARKRVLAALLAEWADPVIRFSDHVRGKGPAFFREACDHALEGIVSKRADAVYRSGRGRDWVKIKCAQRQEFVIGGFTEPSGSRSGFGSLLLGVHEEGKLRYVGNVGTGFKEDFLTELRQRLESIERDDPPFSGSVPRAQTRAAHWVEPRLVGEVEFTEWTRDGRLRHPSFQGLREDIPATDVVREPVQDPPEEPIGSDDPRGRVANPSRRGREEVAGVRLTNPGRVLYPGQGITKRDLALFYEAIGERILPHVAARPLTMLRCPRGEGEACFYQKHADDAFPDSVLRVPVPEANGEVAQYVAIDSLPGLIALVQFGVLEFHVWGSRLDDLERPDRLVFDLDPGPRVQWTDVVTSTRTLGETLEGLGLPAFLKTTGGKGLHVEVPIVPEHDWETVKMFTQAVAQRVARGDPGRYTLNASKSKRSGRIFLDYLRNGRGATAVTAYSTRARKGAPVATPVRWDELGPRLSPDRYNVRNLRRRLAALGEDPWHAFEKSRASLTSAIEEIIEE